MFEASTGVATADLRSLLTVLAHIEPARDDAERIDQLALLERLKSVLAAGQARITVDLVDSQALVAEAARGRARAAADAGDFETWRAERDAVRAATCDDGSETALDTRRAGRRRRPGGDIGVKAQVALARRESPTCGGRHVRTALTLVRDMPNALSALESGALTEHRADLLVQETAILTAEQRALVDAELADHWADELGWCGDRELVRRVRAVCYRIDAESVVARARQAESDRRVSLRPAPDTMSYLTALLPVAEGVAVLAALTKAADSARAAGDVRSKGQVMADALVTRATGQETASAVPVEVQLVMTDRALLAGAADPAQVPGYGTVPAAWARQLLGMSPAEAVETTQPERAQVWLRRLYTHPGDGTLVTMDSSRRVFDGTLRSFLLARDGTCRTPWCDAPIRHLDHVSDHATGGPTSAHNGQGLCVRCNLVKEMAGWRAQTVTSPGWRRHTVELTTPTGHTYRSTAPPILPGVYPETNARADNGSPLEVYYLDRLAS